MAWRFASRPARPRSVLKYHWYQRRASARADATGADGRDGVLHRVAADGDLGAHPLRVQDGRDARGPVAPVEPGQRRPLNPQRIGEVDDVLGDRRLLRHARHIGIQEPGRAVAAQVRHEHAVAGVSQGRDDAVPRADVVRKAVQEDDREPGVVPLAS